MEERDFEVLQMLDKTKNITHAAEQLYISQSTLSKRIAALEEDLGTQLLVRTRTGILFTPAGEICLNTINQVTGELKNMRNQVALTRNILTGRVKASISLNYATFKLADTLSKYHEKYPQIQMHIMTGDSRELYQELVKGETDVGILRGDYPWYGKKVKLASEHVYAIKGTKSKNKSYADIPYIGRKTDLAFSRSISRWMRENQLDPHNNDSFVDNITTCVKMVENGSGWSIVPGICLEDFKGIKESLKFNNNEDFIRSTYLMVSDAALKLPQIRTFVAFVIKEHLKELPEWLNIQ